MNMGADVASQPRIVVSYRTQYVVVEVEKNLSLRRPQSDGMAQVDAVLGFLGVEQSQADRDLLRRDEKSAYNEHIAVLAEKVAGIQDSLQALSASVLMVAKAEKEKAKLEASNKDLTAIIEKAEAHLEAGIEDGTIVFKEFFGKNRRMPVRTLER